MPVNVFGETIFSSTNTSLRGKLQKAPDSPEVMHCFDDRYKKREIGSPTKEK